MQFENKKALDSQSLISYFSTSTFRSLRVTIFVDVLTDITSRLDKKLYRVIFIECDLGKFPKVDIGPTFSKQIFYMDNRCSFEAQVLAFYVDTRFYHFHAILGEKCKV